MTRPQLAWRADQALQRDELVAHRREEVRERRTRGREAADQLVPPSRPDGVDVPRVDRVAPFEADPVDRRQRGADGRRVEVGVGSTEVAPAVDPHLDVVDIGQHLAAGREAHVGRRHAGGTGRRLERGVLPHLGLGDR
jgi:hypothetical protein